MKRKMCLFFSKSHRSDQDFTFVYLLLLKELEPNLIIPGSRSCKCTCLLSLLCNKEINRGLLRPWAAICRCRVAKNLSHSPCRLPAEGEQGSASGFSSHAGNMCPFCGLFSVTFFTLWRFLSVIPLSSALHARRLARDLGRKYMCSRKRLSGLFAISSSA